MSLGFVGVFAEAAALWRRERRLVVPVAGVFFALPVLAVVLMLSGLNFPDNATPEQLREAVMGFYRANLLALMALDFVIDFGTLALMTLFLQGEGRTLGEVLALSLRRFIPYLAIDIVAGALFGLGASLLVLPGLFLFGRTWLAGAAYAAEPARGPLSAFREGWVLSRGFRWITLIGAALAIYLVAMFGIVLATGLIGALAGAVGDALVLPAVAYLACAAIGGAAWTALALVRVAAYRLAVPKQGI